MRTPLLKRFSQESTWRGFIAVAIAIGIQLNPDQIEAIVAAGVALIGAINICKND